MNHAQDRLATAQARYNRDDDKRVKPCNEGITVVHYVYLAPHGPGKQKVDKHVLGRFEVLPHTPRIFLIHRGPIVQRINSDRTTLASTPKKQGTDTLRADTARHTHCDPATMLKTTLPAKRG